MNNAMMKSGLAGAVLLAMAANVFAGVDWDARGDRIDNRLDQRGEAVDERLDIRGDVIDDRLDWRSKRAVAHGNDRRAYYSDRKGHRIEHLLDHKGDRVAHHLDRKGDRINHRLDHRAKLPRISRRQGIQ